MRRRGVLITSITLAVSACGGSPSLPSAPSELARGVFIYEHANYLGTSAVITSDQDDLSAFDGPCEHEEYDDGYTSTYHDWDNCISSVRVAPGWQAMIFDGPNFSGRRMVLTADAPNLQLVAGECDHDGLNDCISSIQVRPMASARAF